VESLLYQIQATTVAIMLVGDERGPQNLNENDKKTKQKNKTKTTYQPE
jgi:hypothetical protein